MFDDMRQILNDEEAFSVVSEIVWLVLGTIYSSISECIVGPCLYCVSRSPLGPLTIPGALGSAVGGCCTTIINFIQKIILIICGPLGPTIGTLATLLWAFGDTIFGFIRGCVAGVLLTLPCCCSCGIVPFIEGILYAIPRSLQVVRSAPQLVGLIGQIIEVIGGAGAGGIATLLGGGGLLCGGGILAALLGGCVTVLFGGIAGIPIIGGPLAALCGGIAGIPVVIGGLLTTVIGALSGIPIIGGTLSAIIGGLGTFCLGIPSAICCGVPASLLGGGGIASIPAVIGRALAPLIAAITGIPIIGGPLAILCGGLASFLGCAV
jgi:hypothetical protein